MNMDNDFSSPPSSRDRAQGELFKLTADIKRSADMLKAEYNEVKQQYRSKMRLLKLLESQIYENYEADQMELFESGISISPDVQKLLTNPQIE
tara:strand:+ start:402 stop:680 length:279 start_codon:yes stop_codon:yes gene_type:complete